MKSMLTKGVRILDKVNRVVRISLPDILAEITNGNQFLLVDIIF